MKRNIHKIFPNFPFNCKRLGYTYTYYVYRKEFLLWSLSAAPNHHVMEEETINCDGIDGSIRRCTYLPPLSWRCWSQSAVSELSESKRQYGCHWVEVSECDGCWSTTIAHQSCSTMSVDFISTIRHYSAPQAASLIRYIDFPSGNSFCQSAACLLFVDRWRMDREWMI